MATWVAYWAGLILWRLGPAIPVLWRASRSDGHGSASATFGDGALHLSVIDAATTLWKADISGNAIVLWAAIPPLALWAVWLTVQRRADPEPVDRLLQNQNAEPSVPTSHRDGEIVQRTPVD